LHDVRRILQKSKHIKFENEEDWDLTFKTYDELVEAYIEQNALPKVVFLEAIENTNILADMIENFELDYTYKYPKTENAEQVFLEKINNALVEKRLDNDIYRNRIEYELQAIRKTKQ